MERRFKHFTDYEVYMLSRQCVEASFEIVMMDNYSKEEQQIHADLMNELIQERKIREYGEVWLWRLQN